MAKTPAGVYDLLNQLWTPAREVALREAADLQATIDKEGGNFKLEAGDWRYYTEKVRKARFDLDEQALRPYFKLDNVRAGRVLRREQAVRPHVHAAARPARLPPRGEGVRGEGRDGSHLAVFYTDYHPRPGKRVGAWTGGMRGSVACATARWSARSSPTSATSRGRPATSRRC